MELTRNVPHYFLSRPYHNPYSGMPVGFISTLVAENKALRPQMQFQPRTLARKGLLGIGSKIWLLFLLHINRDECWKEGSFLFVTILFLPFSLSLCQGFDFVLVPVIPAKHSLATMFGFISIALANLVLLWLSRTLVSLNRNIAAAKKSGIPYRIARMFVLHPFSANS